MHFTANHVTANETPPLKWFFLMWKFLSKIPKNYQFTKLKPYCDFHVNFVTFLSCPKELCIDTEGITYNGRDISTKGSNLSWFFVVVEFWGFF